VKYLHASSMNGSMFIYGILCVLMFTLTFSFIINSDHTYTLVVTILIH